MAQFLDTIIVIIVMLFFVLAGWKMIIGQNIGDLIKEIREALKDEADDRIIRQ
jgi:Sec-independent protein translocase protein TatA